MNYKMMGRFIAQIITIEGIFMLPALGIGLFCNETGAAIGFGVTLAIMLCVAGLLYLLCRKAGKLFGAREGMVCVSISWITMSLLGALPFFLSGQIDYLYNGTLCFFTGYLRAGCYIKFLQLRLGIYGIII